MKTYKLKCKIDLFLSIWRIRLPGANTSQEFDFLIPSLKKNSYLSNFFLSFKFFLLQIVFLHGMYIKIIHFHVKALKDLLFVSD